MLQLIQKYNNGDQTSREYADALVSCEDASKEAFVCRDHDENVPERTEPRLLHYLVQSASGVISKQPHSPEEVSSVEWLDSLFRSDIRSAVDLVFGQYLHSECIDVILSFINLSINPYISREEIKQDEAHVLASHDNWLWIFFHTVIITPIDTRLSQLASAAALAIPKKDLRRDKTWAYSFYSVNKRKKIYFWRTTTKPLVSKIFPKQLQNLYKALCSEFPIMSTLTECLPAIYYGRDCLNWHIDDVGETYFGIRESVSLFFAGKPRLLQFKPLTEPKILPRGCPPNRSMVVSIECTEHLHVHMTPLANIMFRHSKAPCITEDLSVTLAFRRGIPLKAAREIYPHTHRYRL